MSKTKKWIVALLVPALLIGAVFGTYQILRANREPAKVYPVVELAEQNYNDYNNYLSGEVRTDRLQTVYPSSTLEVIEVLVSVGDSVQKGDPLIRYNTTLSELELERKAIEIQKAQDELDKAQRTYRSYFRQDYVIPPVSAEQAAAGLAAQPDLGGKPVFLSAPIHLSDTEPPEPVTEATEPVTEATEPVTEATEPVTEATEPVTEATEPVTEATEPVTEATEPVTEPTEPETEPTEPETEPEEPVVDGVVVTILPMGGSGTPEDPALYLVGSAYGLTPALMEELLGEADTVDLVVASAEEDLVEGSVISAYGLTLTREETGWSVRFWDAGLYLGKPLAPLAPEPEPEPEPTPVIPDYPSGPTWQELQQIRKELEERMRDLDLQIRMDQVTYRAMEAELGDGTIRAEFDGVVLSLTDADEALELGEPMLKVSGSGGGYKIVCSVSEYQVESIRLGQTATVSTWFGDQYSAVVTEIAQEPVKDYYDSYQNASYYPVTFEVDASANMGESYWVDVVLDGGGEVRVGGYYLIKAFVLTENGKSYVMVRGEDGLLEKRQVNTGRDLYGYEVEILGGLTLEDYIAFPYAKTALEGAKTEEADLQELMGYSYY